MSVENCKQCNMNIDTDYMTMEEHQADCVGYMPEPQDVDDLADYNEKVKKGEF